MRIPASSTVQIGVVHAATSPQSCSPPPTSILHSNPHVRNGKLHCHHSHFTTVGQCSGLPLSVCPKEPCPLQNMWQQKAKSIWQWRSCVTSFITGEGDVDIAESQRKAQQRLLVMLCCCCSLVDHSFLQEEGNFGFSVRQQKLRDHRWQNFGHNDILYEAPRCG